MQPFFSIIVATYNVENYIGNLIQSLNEQTFISYEVILSDGGSTDGSLNFFSDKIIRNLAWTKSAKDDGLYYALNEGLAHAKGDWVIVLGADDELVDENALRNVHNLIANLPTHWKFLYGNLQIRSNFGKKEKYYPVFEQFARNYDGYPPIHHQTAIISRECFRTYGNFNTYYKIHSDFDLMCRIMQKELPQKIEVTLVSFHDGGTSSNWKNIFTSLKEMTAIRKIYNGSVGLRIYLPYLRIMAKKLYCLKNN